MSLARPVQLLHGIQPAALRDCCLREASQLTERWPDKRAVLLVPEQAKLDLERQYLALSGRNSLLMAEVLSFRRFAYRLAGELGLETRRAVNPTGQAMLLHRILKDRQAELQAFANLADRPGFIQQIAAVIGDLRRYRLDPSALQLLGSRLNDQPLQHKIADFALILDDYQQALDTFQLSDSEMDLTRLAEWLGQLSPAANPAAAETVRSGLAWLAQTSVWVSGFGELRDFTPQEYQVLQALADCCEQLTVTVMADGVPADPLAIDSGPDIFLPGRRCAYHLRRALPLVQTRSVPANWPAGNRELARHLGAPLAPADSARQNPLAGDRIRLVRAEDDSQAIAWVAGEIRRLVLTGHYRFADINVAVCSPATMLPQIRASFRLYDIPLFLDAVRPLSGTPLLRYLLGILDVNRFGWSRQAVMQVLRSGLTGLGQSVIDQMENYWLARGSFRSARLFAGETYDPTDPQAALTLAGSRQVLDPLRDLQDRMRQTQTCGERCACLIDYLEAQGMQDRIGGLAAELQATGDPDSALALVKAWNALADLFAQLQLLLGTTVVPLQTFRDLVAAGMDNADSGVLPGALDQVAIGSLERSRLRPCRLLFIVGATAASLPPQPPAEGLLKDADRASLSAALNQTLPSRARDQVFADAAMIYSLLTLPDDCLYLTAGGTDVSPYWLRLAEWSGVGPVRLDASLTWPDVRLHAPTPALTGLLQACRQDRPAADRPQPLSPAQETWPALAAVLQAGGTAMDQARAWLERRRSLTVLVPAELLSQRYGYRIQMSISQLERYARCPFQHLASDGLALQERPVWTPAATDSGTLLHAVIEQCFRTLQADLARAETAEATRSVLAAWLAGGLTGPVDQAMAELRESDRLRLFFEPGLQASLGRRMRRMARTSLDALIRQLQEDTFMPIALEWAFGSADGTGLPVELGDGRSIELRGKIDRVDRLRGPDGPQFRIIDYKTGQVTVDFETLYHGLALQLPAYLAAFANSHPGWQAVDACYFHFDQPIFSLGSDQLPVAPDMAEKLRKHFKLHRLDVQPEDLPAVQMHALRCIRQWTGQLLQGHYSAQPRRIAGHQPACVYCHYDAFCGFDRKSDPCEPLSGLGGLTTAEGKRMNKRQVYLQLIGQKAAESTKEGGTSHGLDT